MSFNAPGHCGVILHRGVLEGGARLVGGDVHVGPELEQRVHGLGGEREVLSGQEQGRLPLPGPRIDIHHLQLPEILDTVLVAIVGGMMQRSPA